MSKLPEGVPAAGAQRTEYTRRAHQEGDCALCGVPLELWKKYCSPCESMVKPLLPTLQPT